MDKLAKVINQGKSSLYKKERNLKSFYNSFNDLIYSNRHYSINNIISKASKIRKISSKYVDYPDVVLSHNWLILSSQLSVLNMAVFNKMVDLYTQHEHLVTTKLTTLN